MLADPKCFRCQCATLVSGSSRAAWLMQMKRLCKRPCVNWKKSSRWRSLWQRCGWMTFCSHCIWCKACKNIPEKERKRCLQKATWRSFSFLHPKQILLVIERWQDARRWCLLVFWKSLHWQLKLEATCKLRLLSVKQTRQILNLLSIHACTCYTEHQTSWKIRTIMCIVSQYDFCLWRRRFTLFFHVFPVKF